MEKARLRQRFLAQTNDPIVFDAFAGVGMLYYAVYSDVERGVAIDKKADAVDVLVEQRPTWSVYQCDNVTALREGVGGHLPCNFFDMDAYGDPWLVIEALFDSDRPWPDRLTLVVTDGMRQLAGLNGVWRVDHLAPAVEKFGNDNLFRRWLDACRFLMELHADRRGYALDQWYGYHCGYKQDMTHYAAVLTKGGTA